MCCPKRRPPGIAREIFASYGYAELRVPLLEQTALFKRAIGEFTDIVEKEMFSFEDRSGDSLTLRPEATAGIARAAISNGLLHNQRHRFYTLGPMFRGERPQKGRYRQFHQIDAETYGYPGPDVDAELIVLSARLWKRLGLEGLTLEINSLGQPAERQAHRQALIAHFEAQAGLLDDDARRRLHTNPLRILDSKNPALAGIIRGAPQLSDYLDPESQSHFDGLRARLDDAGVAYTVNPRLVRGLDYYTRTVFEWVTSAWGAQNAVCSGGRYDGLVAQLGGEPTPAVGWALGIERVVLLLEEQGRGIQAEPPQVFFVMVGQAAERLGFRIAETLRDAWPALRLETGLGGGSFKSQFRRADKSGATLAIVLGEGEVERGVVALKPLRGGEQAEIEIAALPERLGVLLGLG